MVGTILPVVYGERQSNRAASAHTWHLVGLLAGGSLMAVVATVIGATLLAAIPTQEWTGDLTWFVPGIAALAFGLRELDLAPVPMPQSHRQVPHGWRLSMRPPVMALMYGVGLGVAVATYIRTASVYIVLLWVVLVASLLPALIVMSCFALGRGLPLVVLASATRSIQEAHAITDVVERLVAAVHVLNGMALALIGSAFVLRWLL